MIEQPFKKLDTPVKPKDKKGENPILSALNDNVDSLMQFQMPGNPQVTVSVSPDGYIIFNFQNKTSPLQCQQKLRAPVKNDEKDEARPEFEEANLMAFENQLLVMGVGAIKFCIEYAGLSKDEVKKLYQNSSVKEDIINKWIRDYERSLVKKPPSKLNPVENYSDNLKKKAQEFQFYNDDKTTFNNQGKIYEEILSTEKAYIEALSKLGANEKESYLKAFDKLTSEDKGKFISKKEFEEILNLCSEIETLHRKIYSDLQQSPANLLKHIEELNKLYANYASLYQKIKERGGVPEYINTLYKDDLKFNLEDILIKPIQRINMYNLFYGKELLDKKSGLPPSHSLYAEVEQISQKLKETALLMETKVKPKEIEGKKMRVTVRLEGAKEATARKEAKKILRGYHFEDRPKTREDREKHIEDTSKKLIKELGLPETWAITAQNLKKSPKDKIRKTARFIVKDTKTNQDIFKITISNNEITIKELKPGDVSESNYVKQLEAMNALMNKLMEELPEKQPRILTQDARLMAKMEEIGVNYERSLQYILGGAQLRQVRKENPLVVKIDSSGQESDKRRVKNLFKAQLDKGAFVPELQVSIDSANKSKYGSMEIDNEPLEISTTNAELAIKQYEAVLAAGYTPKFSPKTKEIVQEYTKNEVSNSVQRQLRDIRERKKLADRLLDPNISAAERTKINTRLQENMIEVERQIIVSAPKVGNREIIDPLTKEKENISVVDAGELIKRIRKATEDGFLVQLNKDDKDTLRRYLDTPEGMRAASVPIKYSGSAPLPIVMRELLAIGLKVEILDREAFNEDVKKIEKFPPVKINSGNVSHDFNLLSECFRVMGLRAQITDENAMKSHVGKLNIEPTFVLDNLPPEYHIEDVKALAKIGIYAKVSEKLNIKNQEIAIESDNPNHAVGLFKKYIHDGFAVNVGPNTLLGLKNKTKERCCEVTLKGNEAQSLLSRLSLSMKYGFAVDLNKEQINTLRNFILKQGNDKKPILEIAGENPEAIRKNIELAQKLGIMPTITNEAKQAYNQSNREHVEIPVHMKLKSGFLRTKIEVVDIKQTIEHASTLASSGINVKWSADMEKVKSKAQSDKDMKGFFNRGKRREAQRIFDLIGVVEKVNKDVQDNLAIPKTVPSTAGTTGQRAQPILSKPSPSHMPVSVVAQVPMQPQTSDSKAIALENIDMMLKGFRSLQINPDPRYREDATKVSTHLNELIKSLENSTKSPQEVNKELKDILEARKDHPVIQTNITEMGSKFKELEPPRSRHRLGGTE
ncbi:MAG: hypothetical protein JSR17_00905 [Proteobacteria bacterium]|nr:hypothetical protein [Pseudomonadota bacterium]